GVRGAEPRRHDRHLDPWPQRLPPLRPGQRRRGAPPPFDRPGPGLPAPPQVIRYGRQAPTRRGTVGPLGSSPAVRPAVPRRAVEPRPANPPDLTTAPSTLTAHTGGQLPAAPGRGRRVQTPDARPHWSALRAPLPAPGIRDLRDL